MSPPHPTRRPPVVVLGAGLTGMSAALALKKANIQYRLLERAPHPGGLAATRVEAGYRFDRTGHLLHLQDDGLRRQVESWLGDDALTVARRSRIWSHGVYTRYPFQSNTHGLPPAVAFDCLLGFVKAHFSEDQAEPRTFYDFCLKHFGEGISRHFMLPYNTRLWGVAAQEITAQWCGRFIPVPTLEDVLAGAVGHEGRELGYNRTFIYPRLGIGQLSLALYRELDGVELGRSPVSIDLRARRLHLPDESIDYGVLINTSPLPVLCSLLKGSSSEIHELSGKLRHTSLYYLDVALDAPCQKDVHWVYVPEEKYPFYRVGCYSHFSPAMAPPGKDGLYVELVGRTEPDLSILVPSVASALVEMGIIRKRSDVAFARLRRLDYAYVIFDDAYHAITSTIHALLEQAHILSTGRYGGWNYSSMGDALRYGQDAAARAEQLLT